MKNNNGYNYDALTNKLYVTADFLKKAGKLNTPEYRILLQFRNDNPGLDIIKKTVTRKMEPKQNISFANMETFIGMCRDKDVRLEELERIKALSKIQNSPYCYVRDWFLNHYANYSEEPQFDEEGYVVPKTKQEMEVKATEKAETAPAVSAEEIVVATMAA